MPNKLTLAIAAGGASLVLAFPVLAQTSGGVAQPGYFKGDLSAFHGDQRSLIKAIQHIHQASGARVVDIRFSEQDGLPGYHVVMQKNGRFTFMHITERDGQVVAIAAANAPDWMLKWNQRADLKWDRRASTSLAQAIRTAESAYNAPAVAAGIAVSASNPTSDVHAFNVVLDVGGQTRRVAVDSSTGQIITDPQALNGFS